MEGTIKRWHTMTSYELRKFTNNEVHETAGFDVDACRGRLPGRIVPIWPDTNEWKPAECAAQFAAETHNEGKSVEYTQLVKANMQPISGTMYYLTFTGTDFIDQVEKLYRAKVRANITTTLDLLFFEEVPDSHTIAKKMREEAAAMLAKIDKIRRKTSPECESSESNSLSKDKKNTEEGGEIHMPPISCQRLYQIGFYCLLKEIRGQNPSWKHNKVKKAASKQWRSLSTLEKAHYQFEALKEHNKRNRPSWAHVEFVNGLPIPTIIRSELPRKSGGEV